MKKQPKAVYIIENGEYTELTYEEFLRREQICPSYADKLFLPLYGRLMEVSKEDYAEFYRAKRRQKYLDERSADNGDFSYDMLTTDEFSGEDILIADQPDVCDTVISFFPSKTYTIAIVFPDNSFNDSLYLSILILILHNNKLSFIEISTSSYN